MNIDEFIKKYGEFAENTLEIVLGDLGLETDWDEETLEKELENLIEYGKIEIVYDEDSNVINYTLGYSDLGVKELGLSHYDKIENQPVWGTDYLDDPKTLEEIPEELLKQLKQEI